ncbi:MAG: site-2 protease family protein [Clostridia bacterium]|nr:site-2 protease family protein [Clostridia bacterium]
MSFLIGSAGQVALSIFVAIIALMVMILVHESGHYLLGKALKFKINEFSIGFGPKLFSKKSEKTGEVFSIRAVPLGGFCAFEGEDADSAVEGSFNSQKPWKRIVVLLAGVTFNFISAVLILTVLFATYGYTLPKIVDLNVPTDSAFVQNFEEGDLIYQVDGKNVYSVIETNISTLLSGAGETAEVVVIRNGEKVSVTVQKGEFESKTVDKDGNETDSKYHGFGINIGYAYYRMDLFEALGRSFIFIWQLVILTFKTIGGLFTGAVGLKGSVGGTVTSVAAMGKITMTLGFRGVLLMFGIMSASVALMNALPFPALDGCRVIFVLIEMIFRKPVNRKVEAIIHTVGIVILFAFAILCDILNLGTIARLF